MKYFILLFFLCISSVMVSQNYTEKYNDLYNRYEYFGSDGQMVGYKQYNTVSQQWEYTDLKASNSNQSGRYIVHDYGKPQSTFNTDLAIQALTYKQGRYQVNSEKVLAKARGLIDDLDAYKDLEKREKAKEFLSSRFNKYFERNNHADYSSNYVINQINNHLILMYNETIDYISKLQPKKDADFYFNEGVKANENKFFYTAKENYLKALELDSNHLSTLINLSVLILKDENDIVEEMNSLGFSDTDKKKYTELSDKRKTIYKEALPYLERAIKISPNNIQVKRAIESILKAQSVRDNWFGGYTAETIEEYEFDEVKNVYNRVNVINEQAKLFFTPETWHFKREDNPIWLGNLWSKYQVEGNKYGYVDERGGFILINLNENKVTIYNERIGNSDSFKKLYFYTNIKKNDTVHPE